jgi:hypothetical protein
LLNVKGKFEDFIENEDYDYQYEPEEPEQEMWWSIAMYIYLTDDTKFLVIHWRVW